MQHFFLNFFAKIKKKLIFRKEYFSLHNFAKYYTTLLKEKKYSSFSQHFFLNFHAIFFAQFFCQNIIFTNMFCLIFSCIFSVFRSHQPRPRKSFDNSGISDPWKKIPGRRNRLPRLPINWCSSRLRSSKGTSKTRQLYP